MAILDTLQRRSPVLQKLEHRTKEEQQLVRRLDMFLLTFTKCEL